MASTAHDQEIERLIRLERYLRDTGDWKTWRQCFHPDDSRTWINISWHDGSIDEWVKRSEQLAAKGVSTLHTVVPIDVQVKGDRGMAISSCQVVSRFRYCNLDHDLTALMRLVSCFEQVHGTWKMVSLEGIYLQDSIQSVVSSSNQAVEWGMDLVSNPRDSYKCLIWNIERKGLKARRDLPGIDRPESVKEVMQRANAWIGISTTLDELVKAE